MKQESFTLTDAQLDQISRYFANKVKLRCEADEIQAENVKVIFEWSPFGRSVTAVYDDEISGCEIEDMFS